MTTFGLAVRPTRNAVSKPPALWIADVVGRLSKASSTQVSRSRRRAMKTPAPANASSYPLLKHEPMRIPGTCNS
ncbi:hypothetical protein D9615_003860 [Tricholomella constricta]|uniref:Uncharacterized protein n=1 Tax=Tricholomella constricta TaxID=117010 RepID=A0A8H5HD63_9AGAR|nr:hypothetical protein D9615_003860 [Tricholomella constricta]